MTKISPPSKKVKGLIQKKKPSKIGHFGSLGDLGVKEVPTTKFCTNTNAFSLPFDQGGRYEALNAKSFEVFHALTTLSIPISVCYYLELRNAIMFEQLIDLSSVETELMIKISMHCVAPNSNTH